MVLAVASATAILAAVSERPSAAQIGSASVPAPLPADAAPTEAPALAPIKVDYPEDGSVFPPEFLAPTFLWRDPSPATAWQIEVAFPDGAPPVHGESRGERMRIGEIDPRCVPR